MSLVAVSSFLFAAVLAMANATVQSEHVTHAVEQQIQSTASERPITVTKTLRRTQVAIHIRTTTASASYLAPTWHGGQPSGCNKMACGSCRWYRSCAEGEPACVHCDTASYCAECNPEVVHSISEDSRSYVSSKTACSLSTGWQADCSELEALEAQHMKAFDFGA